MNGAPHLALSENTTGSWWCGSMVEHLLRTHKALPGSSPSTSNTQKCHQPSFYASTLLSFFFDFPFSFFPPLILLFIIPHVLLETIVARLVTILIYAAEDDLELPPPASVSKVSWVLGLHACTLTAFQTVILMVRLGIQLLGSKSPPFSAHTHLNFLKAKMRSETQHGQIGLSPRRFGSSTSRSGLQVARKHCTTDFTHYPIPFP